MTVDALRSHLTALELAARFDGRAYPEGLEPVPRALVGQGFFPGGDGLWRDADPEALRRPSPYTFPVGGIMFLGNDFGTLARFPKSGLYENVPTWRWLRERLDHAGLPGWLGFYTNAYLGLRSDRSALAHPMDHPGYRAACAEYLAVQLRIQMPKLVVVLGGRPAGLLGPLIGLSDMQIGQVQPGRFEEKCLWVLSVSHPYSDLGKSPVQRAAEGALLKRSWSEAQRCDPAVRCSATIAARTASIGDLMPPV